MTEQRLSLYSVELRFQGFKISFNTDTECCLMCGSEV